MLARKHGRQAGGRRRCPPAHTGRNFLLRTASEAGEEGVANGTTCVACGRGCGTRARGVSLSELLGPGGSQACPALRPAQVCSRPDQARGETGLMQPCCRALPGISFHLALRWQHGQHFSVWWGRERERDPLHYSHYSDSLDVSA
jgi:hypothetical protein